MVLLSKMLYNDCLSFTHAHSHTSGTMQGADLTIGINLWFSVLPKDTSTYRQGKLGIELPPHKRMKHQDGQLKRQKSHRVNRKLNELLKEC